MADMLYGMSKSKSCMLSEIARSLEEPISEKKTVERLSNGLMGFGFMDTVLDNYTDLANKHLGSDPLWIVDGSDLAKPCSKHMEYATRVWDGSKKCTVNGYSTLQIAALSNECKVPLPVYDRVYSSIEPGFVSYDHEVLKGLAHLTRHFGKRGIRTLDRGYDANVYFQYFVDHNERFIVRLKENRHVTYKGESMSPKDLAMKFKGKYAFTFQDKHGKTIPCKLTHVPVTLHAFGDVRFRLVFVYGFGQTPMMLLTNMHGNEKALAVTITKAYLLRWRIEEHFRCQKQQYRFENFRVRSIAGIRTLHRILAILALFIGTLSEAREQSSLSKSLIAAAKRLSPLPRGREKRIFLNYAIIDGLASLLLKASSGIRSFFPPRFPPRVFQISMMLPDTA